MSTQAAAPPSKSQVPQLFDRADQLLFKERKYQEAESIYKSILEMEPENVDAINSIAYCVKFMAAVSSQALPENLFENLQQLYKRALTIDPTDVEANFNLGLLFLQFNQDQNLALECFENCVKRNVAGTETAKLFQAQFAKSYYNIGMIYDKIGNVQAASDSYKKSMQTCEADQAQQLTKSTTYKKAGTNYAVTLEKLGARESAMETFGNLKKSFSNEVRIHNNLGIINKRQGDTKEALQNYQNALQVDPQSFFPNYNMGVLMSTSNKDESLSYFSKALELAHRQQEQLYELNVLINISLLHEASADYQKAIDALQHALRIEPENQQVKNKLAQLMEMLNNKMQGSQLSPAGSNNAKSAKESEKARLSESQELRKNEQSDFQRRPSTKQDSPEKEKSVQGKVDLLDDVVIKDPNSKNDPKPDQAYGQDDINTPRASRQGSAPSNIDRSEQEEARRMIESRKSSRSKAGSQLKKQEGEEESYEDEFEEDDPKPTYDNWLSWSQEQATEMAKSKDVEAQKRAFYRLGLISQIDNELHTCLKHFEKVTELDPSFCKSQVALRIAEVQYKLNDIDEAFRVLERIEDELRDTDKYMLHLLKGKCYDKNKLYKQSVLEYQQAIDLGQQFKIEDEVLGQIYFRLGWSIVRTKQDIEMGVENLKKANQMLKDNTEVMIKLAGVLFQESGSDSDIKQAGEILDKLIILDPNNAEAHLLKGKIQHKNKEWAESITSLEQAIQIQAEDESQGPPKPNSFYFLGMSYEKTKDFKKSMQNYKKTLTLDNNHFGGCIHLANLLANLGEGQRAAKYFKHAIKIDPESLNAHFGLGKALQQYSEDKDAPIPHFEEVLKREPKHFKTLTQLGILYLDREEFEKSADCLKKALQSNREFPLALVSMGNLLFETGHAEQAIKYHLQALKFNEKELQALIGLGNAYYDTGNPNDAVTYYKKALDIDNHLSDVHYNLGNALYLNEVIEEAIKHYKAAIQLNPKKPESFYNLGNALCVKSDYENAVQAYEQAIELDPKNAPAFYNLGNALYMLNRFEESVKSYHKALEINNESPECHFNLASAYNDLGKYSHAIRHYQEAIALDNTNVDAHMCLAGVYEQIQQYEKAVASFKNVVKIDPDSTKAHEALQKLKAISR